MKCTKLDLCRTRNYACSFKRKDDFEGVCVDTEMYGLSMPWPYDLVMKWEREKAERLKREKAEMAERLEREKAAVEEDNSLIHETKFDSDPKPSDTPFQTDPQLPGALQTEFRLTETPVTCSFEPELPVPDPDINPDPENIEPSSKIDDNESKVGFEVEEKMEKMSSEDSSPSTGKTTAVFNITCRLKSIFFVTLGETLGQDYGRQMKKSASHVEIYTKGR